MPVQDRALYSRADVVVHGIVLSSDATVDGEGRPETLTVIEPIEVLKGSLTGSLVLHQLGGDLPDGRFLQLWGRPEYTPGREVVVFAIARTEGEFQTAEMLLGKFEVQADRSGQRFAVPDFANGVHEGVDLYADEHDVDSHEVSAAPDGGRKRMTRRPIAEEIASPRRLDLFLSNVRRGDFRNSAAGPADGDLQPVLHSDDSRVSRPSPKWANIGSLWRWNNSATAAFSLLGTANMTGGGVAEATGALAAWTNNPNSDINYSVGTGASTIDLNALTSGGCGWSTCLSGGGVIGCGGPSGGGSNTWRGESYVTITRGFVQLRAACSLNGFGSTITQAVIEHELGHTLGLGHSDQAASGHDTCRGDEDQATMRSVVQSRITLGTDDIDAARWLYGDGGNSCTASATPTVTALSPSLALPQQTGTSITWTATATGGTPPLQYRFWRYSALTGAWTMVRDYAASNAWSWTPGASDAGQFALQVWVRNSGSTANWDAWLGTPVFSIRGPAPIISALTASPTLPRPAGTTITWQANASGGVGPLQFRFYRFSAATGAWTMVRDYSIFNSWSWTPSAAEVGQYSVQVWVRNANSVANWDAWGGTAPFSITGGTPVVTSIVAAPALPQHAGTPITWTANAVGGSPPLQYRFWRYSLATGQWTIVRDYSASNAWTWTPTAGETGQYLLQVWVRNPGSPAAYDAWLGTAAFTITP